MRASPAASHRQGRPLASDAAPAPRVFHLPRLDALRFIAFTMVFAFHACPQAAEVYAGKGLSAPVATALALVVQACGFGVDLFFVVSAYLITTLLRSEIALTGRLDIGAFYMRRILRIWPLYYAFLIGGFAVQAAMGLDALAPSTLALFVVFLGNWPWTSKPATPFGILWSLCVEEQFYLLWPLLLRRAPLPAALWRWSLAVVAAAILARLAYALAGADDLSTWTSSVTRLDPIAFGVLLAVVPRPRVPAPRLVVPLAFAGLVAVAAFDRLAAPRYGLVLGFTAAGVLCTVVVAAAIDASDEPMARVFAPILHLGRISFGLYVFHATMLALALALVPPPASTPVQLGRIALAYLGTLGLAELSYTLLERPFLAMKGRFTPRPRRS